MAVPGASPCLQVFFIDLCDCVLDPTPAMCVAEMQQLRLLFAELCRTDDDLEDY